MKKYTDYIHSVLPSYKGIFTHPPKTTPSNAEPDGALCGNGDIGVTLGGDSQNLQFFLSKNDFWRAKSHQDGGGMKSIGYLQIQADALQGADFYAEQHLTDAVITTDMHQNAYGIHTQTTVLRGTNLITSKVTCTGAPTAISVKLCLNEDPAAICSSTVNQNILQITKAYQSEELDWPCKVCVRGIIIDHESPSFLLQTGQTVTIVLCIYTNQDSESYQILCENEIAELSQEKLTASQKQHTDWWDAFWETSGICIPSEPQVEKFWYASHYLMACCCEKGKAAPGIFGSWITTDSPNWGADYHLNYNHQAPWWGVFSSNKVFLSEPYDTPLLDFMPESKKAARDNLDCHGLYSMVGCGPKGLRTAQILNENGSDSPSYWGQKSNASYAAVNMMMRYYSTYDQTYAKNIAYPYVKEVVAFWEDYLRYEDGRYVDYNDCIHENGWEVRNVFSWGDSVNYADDFNPILTLGLLRVVFQGVLDLAAEVDPCNPKIEKWQEIYTHLPEYPTTQRNGKTIFRLTEKGMEWNDTNSLGIQHIFPCGRIGLSSAPALLQIATDTFEAMSRWEDYNAFPTFYTAGARIGYDPDIILEKMKAEFQKHGYDNLFVYYGGGGIECCSTVPSCINEMMLQTYQGVIRLFPVWNRQKDASFYQLRGYGAFVLSASLKDGVVCEVSLLSEKGRDCTIQSPWESGMTVCLNGKPIPTQNENNCYHFATIPNGVYTICATA